MNEQPVTVTRLEGRQLQALLTAVEAQLSDLADRDALNRAHALLTLAVPLARRLVLALPD